MTADVDGLVVVPAQPEIPNPKKLSSTPSFALYGLKRTCDMVVSHNREAHSREVAGQSDEQAMKQKKANEDANEEGFTRSISLYWNWVRGQKAAARVGKGLARNSTALILQCEHWLEAADPKHRYGTNLRPYFDCWLNQQAKARDAATARHTYIPYSAIPEIAAQAAAEASNNSSSSNTSTAAVPEQPFAAGEGCAGGCNPCSSGAAGAAGAGPGSAAAEPPPATPRRSRSAPNLGDLPSAAAAEDEDIEYEEAAAATPSADASTPCGPAGMAAADSCAASSSSSSKQRHKQSVSAPPATLQSSASINLGLMSGPPPLPGIHTDDRFFYWLDDGAGRHVDLADRGVPRGKLESERVQYLTESERNQLEVTVEASTGLLVYKVSGQTVHTGSELSLVQLNSGGAAGAAECNGSAAAAARGAGGAGDAAAASSAAAALAGSSGLKDASLHESLQRISEAAAEDEEDEEEEQQQQGEGSQQQQRRQQQQAALQQMQQHLWQQQPMCTDRPQQQQQQQEQIEQHMQEQQLYSHLEQQQQQPGQATMEPAAHHEQYVIDTEMVDADAADPAAAEGPAVCLTPGKAAAFSPGYSHAAAATAAATAATPTAAAYGAVAGAATPGTTGTSQRRRSLSAAAAAGEQSVHGGAAGTHAHAAGGVDAPAQDLPQPFLSAQQQQQQQGFMHPQLQQQQHQNGLHSSQNGAAAPAAAAAAAGGGPSGRLLQIKEKPCKWIYVLDTSGRLFVHAKYRGKFHHSSFLQGGAVLSAGGIVVEHGRILKLTADSGHYRPNFDSFMSTVQLLKDWGADLSQTKLSAKHIKCPQLPEAGPSGGV